MRSNSQDSLDGIAIIGLTGRFPGANSIETFWENLKGGVESISVFSDEELSASGIDVGALKDYPNYVRARGILEDVDHFDASFFGINPKEAEVIDPQQRLFLEAAWEALEKAGYDPENYKGSIGVYAGMSNNYYFLSNVYPHPELIELVGGLQTMMGNEKDYLATRVSYKLNLKGPSVSVYTACSTSLVAVCQACQSLQSYQCDMALAGGVSITLPQKRGYLYQEGGIGSADGHCRAFDAKAQGTVFSNGLGIVVLKRLEDAISDGDTIYAVIKGHALNNDGSSKVSYTAPSVDGQAEVIVMAQALAGIDAETITYVETHGTGTPLGDPIEIAGLTQAFRAGTTATGFCAIGSLKSNVGHLDAAAGVAGLIKTVLALKHRQIPPSLHFEKPNPKIDFPNSPFYVNTRLSEWKTEEIPRRAGVSSLGVGGTNAHVVLEEAPPLQPSSPSRSSQLLLLSAKTSSALEKSTENLVEYLSENQTSNFADVAYTLQVGRRAFEHRRIITCSDIPSVLKSLKSKDPKVVFTQVQEYRDPPIVFMFPGQGVQHVNMGLELYRSEVHFREQVDGCSEILRPLMGLDLRKLIYPKESQTEEAQKQLTQTWITQPALFMIEYALARLWMSWGIRPESMIGHSVGEYVAACLAEVFTLEEALGMLASRARLMQQLPGGAMLAVRLPRKELESLLPQRLSIAAINGPSLCVVSGPTDAVEVLHKELSERQIMCRPLHTSHAFHSEMMDPVLNPYTEIVKKAKLSPPKIPYVSNLSADWIKPEEAMAPSYWAQHLRHAVRFAESVQLLMKDPRRIFLEIGPGQTLSTLVRQQQDKESRQVVLSSLEGVQDQESGDVASVLKTLGRLWLCGVSVDWDRFYSNERRHRMNLPSYPFERKRYWIEPSQPGPFEMLPSLEIESEEAQNPADDEASRKDREEERKYMTEPDEEIHSEPNRSERILAAVKNILQEMSGINLDKMAPGATLVEMGFDSLFLTQASQALQKKFGLKITFRQMLEELTGLTELAKYIDEKLPPEAFPGEVVVRPSKKQKKSAPTSKLLSSLLPDVHQEVNPSISTDIVERIMKEQLQIMAQQLEMLKNISSSQPHLDAKAEERLHQISRTKDVEIATDSPGSQLALAPEPKPEPKFFGPFKPMEKGPSGGLTLQQQGYLDTLINRYVERTKGSKEYTKTYRSKLADPRAVAGFRQLWKEMVYPIVSTRSLGSKIWDVDGNEYIDITMGFGMGLFGHRPSFVIDAVKAQLDVGIEIGPQSPMAGKVAELICEFTGMDRVTFCNTGSEAVMAAIRVARTVTGRDKIALFSGSYHGVFDEVLVRSLNIKGQLRAGAIAPGIPEASLSNLIVLEYGTQEALEILKTHSDELAAVLVEPVQSRRPDLQPVEFLQELRRLTEKSGTAFVMDEVVTGFRVHPEGAQSLFGIKADMGTYGKVLGGGLPIGILAGKAAFMDALDGGAWNYGDSSFPETGMTFFAGTFVRHPLALAAAWAVLNHLKTSGPELQRRLTERTSTFVAEMNSYLGERGLPFRVPHFSSSFFLTFPPELKYSSLFFYYMREKGIHVWEGRPCFVSTAHSTEDMDRVMTAFKESIAQMQEAGFLPYPPYGQGDNLIANLQDQASSKPGEAVLISIGASETIPNTAPTTMPLTEVQEEVWLAAQMGEDASCAYNESITISLRGPLNLLSMVKALETVIGRHEALRTSFSPAGDHQRIYSSIKLELPFVDLSPFDDIKRQSLVKSIISQDSRKAFNLENAPLFRSQLIKLEARNHLLIITAHHIVCDGWSFGVLVKELGLIYSAISQGKVCDLPRAISYSEYAAWQRKQAGSKEAIAAEQYWLDQYSQPVPPLELPTDRSRTLRRTFKGSRERIKIAGSLYDDLKKLSSKKGSTLFMTVLAGSMLLFHRLSHQEDITVGVPAAGQPNMGSPDLVGHCVNLLPLRIRVQPDQKFSEFLKSIKNIVFNSFDHQNYTFGSLIQKLNIPRDSSRLPLVNITFNLDRTLPSQDFHNLKAEIDSNPKTSINFDLKLNLVDTDSGLDLDLDYNSHLFDSDTIHQWLRHYMTLLREIVSNPEAQIQDFPLVVAQDRELVLFEWNKTTRNYAEKSTIQELFETAAEKSKEKVAIVHGSKQLRYGELHARSNQLAHHLKQLGVGPEHLVGIFMERSLDMIVGMLGILKAGAAYVPLDPAYPAERLAYMIQDTQMAIVLTQLRLEDSLPGEKVKAICLDRDWIEIQEMSKQSLNTQSDSRNLSHLIYTSGSTGKPKGVAIEQRSVIAFLHWAKDAFSAEELSGMLASTSICFDLSVFEIFTPLITGGKVIIAKNALELLELKAANEVTLVNTVPSAMRELLKLGRLPASILTVNLAGEPLSEDLVDEIYESSEVKQVNDLYGPSEDTTYSTYALRKAGDRPTIGRPISNTQIYILDSNLEPMPIGVIGEIYIGGAGLARGYLNHPQQTSEKFLPNPYSEEQGARLYKTGDQGRYLRDGNIEFYGRIDHQVKVRGYRIELEEIETTLFQFEGISEAVVIVREDRVGDRRIVAYLVGEKEAKLKIADINNFVKKKLPDYMIPSSYMILGSLPRTPSGKIDRRALPVPDESALAKEERYVAPRTELEKTLVDIWFQILGLKGIGVHDSFFELGGHSLLATRVISKIRTTFGVEIPLGLFFESPTIESLAQAIDVAKKDGAGTLVSVISPVSREARRQKRTLL